MLRKEVQLPEEDIEFLETLGKDWETIREANLEWLLIYGYPVPDGYTISEVNVAILISSGYPMAPLDMAYFHPAVICANGKQIQATQSQRRIDNKIWQRWSRHRTQENPWRIGLDNMSTHFSTIDHWLERELI